jgi:hypothetical protein
MDGDYPGCGDWHGGAVCLANGPWWFIVLMGASLLALAALVWGIARYLDPSPPTDEDGDEPAPRPRRYRFDDEHLDRIAGED